MATMATMKPGAIRDMGIIAGKRRKEIKQGTLQIACRSCVVTQSEHFHHCFKCIVTRSPKIKIKKGAGFSIWQR